MFLYELVDALDKHKVRYALIGGFALALHGIVRATIDVDFVLKLTQKDYENAERAFREVGLTSRLPLRAQDIIKMRVEYIKNRHLLAWSFVDFKDPTRQVDILITTDLDDIDTVRLSVGGRKIHVISLKGLLKMKQEAGRPQDLVDAENIRRKIAEKA